MTTTATKEHKFPKFMGYLAMKGLDIKAFVDILNEHGYEYKYNTVRRRLNGESTLGWDDIVVFCKVLDVDESIFFD